MHTKRHGNANEEKRTLASPCEVTSRCRESPSSSPFLHPHQAASVCPTGCLTSSACLKGFLTASADCHPHPSSICGLFSPPFGSYRGDHRDLCSGASPCYALFLGSSRVCDAFQIYLETENPPDVLDYYGDPCVDYDLWIWISRTAYCFCQSRMNLCAPDTLNLSQHMKPYHSLQRENQPFGVLGDSRRSDGDTPSTRACLEYQRRLPHVNLKVRPLPDPQNISRRVQQLLNPGAAGASELARASARLELHERNEHSIRRIQAHQ